MATGTLDGNIAIIRGASNVGSTVREAIASAIEQEDDQSDFRMDIVESQAASQDVVLTVTQKSGNIYKLNITNYKDA